MSQHEARVPMPQQRSWLTLFLLGGVILTMSGCLSLLTATQSTAAEVRRVSRFDTSCPRMTIVKRMGHRYKLWGCSREVIYACHKTTTFRHGHHRRPHSKTGKTLAVLDALLVGPSLTEVSCTMLASRSMYTPDATRETPPARSWPRASRPATPLERPAGLDAGASKRRSSKKGGAPAAPDGQAVGRALAKVVPKLQACAARRASMQVALVQAKLRVAADGQVVQAVVRAASLTPATRRCLARGLERARLPISAAGPTTLAYAFQLR